MRAPPRSKPRPINFGITPSASGTVGNLSSKFLWSVEICPRRGRRFLPNSPMPYQQSSIQLHRRSRKAPRSEPRIYQARRVVRLTDDSAAVSAFDNIDYWPLYWTTTFADSEPHPELPVLTSTIIGTPAL